MWWKDYEFFDFIIGIIRKYYKMGYLNIIRIFFLYFKDLDFYFYV